MELLKHLQTLQAVVEHGGFRKAADVMETTQPSVTHRIQQLEKHFGTKLLLRGRFDQSSTRAVTLTEAGKLALTHTHHINMHLTAIETGIANLSKPT